MKRFMTKEIIEKLHNLYELYSHIPERILDIKNDVERNASVGEEERRAIAYLSYECEELAGELKKIHGRLS